MKDVKKSIKNAFANIKHKMRIGGKNEQYDSEISVRVIGDPHANYTPQDRLRGLPYEATTSGKAPRIEEVPEPTPATSPEEQSKLKKRAPERVPTDLTAVAQELDQKLQ